MQKYKCLLSKGVFILGRKGDQLVNSWNFQGTFTCIWWPRIVFRVPKSQENELRSAVIFGLSKYNSNSATPWPRRSGQAAPLQEQPQRHWADLDLRNFGQNFSGCMVAKLLAEFGTPYGGRNFARNLDLGSPGGGRNLGVASYGGAAIHIDL